MIFGGMAHTCLVAYRVRLQPFSESNLLLAYRQNRTCTCIFAETRFNFPILLSPSGSQSCKPLYHKRLLAEDLSSSRHSQGLAYRRCKDRSSQGRLLRLDSRGMFRGAPSGGLPPGPVEDHSKSLVWFAAHPPTRFPANDVAQSVHEHMWGYAGVVMSPVSL